MPLSSRTTSQAVLKECSFRWPQEMTFSSVKEDYYYFVFFFFFLTLRAPMCAWRVQGQALFASVLIDVSWWFPPKAHS